MVNDTWHVSSFEKGIFDYTSEIMTAIQQTMPEPVYFELIVFKLS